MLGSWDEVALIQSRFARWYEAVGTCAEVASVLNLIIY